jgi:hypothetical protein
MTDISFAQDSTRVDAVEAAWSACVTDMRAKSATLYWALLVDDAFETQYQRIKGAASDLNLYACDSLSGLSSVAPRLIALSSDEAGRTQLRRALWHCSRKPMLSVIASRIPLAELKRRWEPLHWIRTEDGQRLLLRFADTRVLPSLARVLLPEQWAGLCGALQHWLYVDREGQPAACEPASTAIEPSTALELSSTQLNALMAASEPDTLYDYFQEKLPEMLPKGCAPSQLYRAMTDVCHFADKQGINVWSDRVALVCADFMSEGAFRTHPDLAPLLARRDWTSGQLANVLAVRGIV